ncbi:hypothetical protein [Psychrobacter glacincola]|uniref:hypothetical protein n=1 Tax=Psychrobacter glacincola TaxID=56810 RepID=UPI00191AC826|nr:hypothetical protein [Psychrobacter glacincola]
MHECAIKPYQIFCEWIDAEVNEFSSDRTLLFEVVEIDEQYCFFEGFREVSLLMDGTEISIRRVDISKAEVERRAWSYLIEELRKLNPINPRIFEAIKNNMPVSIQRTLLGRALTIQYMLDKKTLERHHYDYQVRRMRNQCASEIPSFSELIDEVRYADSK